MKKSIVCSIAVYFLLFLLWHVPAAEALEARLTVRDVEKGLVTISGQAADAQKGSMVSILMLNPGNTFENLSVEDINKQTVQFSRQDVLLLDGRFQVEFKMDPPKDTVDNVYRTRISVAGETHDFSLTYYSFDLVRKAMEELNSLTGEGDESAALTEIFAVFGADSNVIYQNLKQPDDAKARLFDLKGHTVYTADDYDAVTAMVQQAIILQAYKEGNAENLFMEDKILHQDILNLNSKAYASTLYETGISKAGREAVCHGLLGKQYKTVDELQTAFEKQCILQGILHPVSNGTGHVAVIIQNCKDVMKGLNESLYQNSDKAKVAAAVMDGNPQSFEELITQLNQAAAQYPAQSGGGNDSSGSGSSGGGGSSRTSSGTVVIPVLPEVTPQQVETPFSDIAAVGWAEEAITALYYRGAVNGKADGIFAPNDAITREEFVKILVKTFDLEDAEAACRFIDVPLEHWAYTSIASTVERKIVSGISGTQFGVGQKITRQDAAAMLFRIISNLGIETIQKEETRLFADNDVIAEYAGSAVLLLQRAGIVRGNEAGEFMPQNAITRAEAAVMIYGVLLYA